MALTVREKVIDKAARLLKEMDSFLKARSLTHSIFVSPSLGPGAERNGQRPIDRAGAAPARSECDLPPRPLAAPPRPAREALFFDNIRLRRAGNQLWSTIIAAELRRVFVSSRT